MKLSQILAGVQVIKLFQTMFGRMVVTHDVEVHAIRYDSRKAGPNDVFVALRGSTNDGNKFIQDAIHRGAKVIVTEEDMALPDSYFMHAGVVKVVVADSRKALAQMAANFFDHPSKKMTVIGVTGTNGKTTTTNLIGSILEAAGQKVGLIGTVEYRIGNERRPALHTTPESLELHELFAAMVDRGCTSVSMEVSSHALHQSRVYGVDFDVAVFTNLTQDHLDYHGTMEEYFGSKKILFDRLKSSATAIFNADDAWGTKMVSDSLAARFRYGMANDSDFSVTDVRLSMSGTTFTVNHQARTSLIQSPLLGLFNVYNSVAAFATCATLDISDDQIQKGLAHLHNVKGRFERISSPKGWIAIVDYAHTPDALEKCLKAIHDIMPTEERGRIITVFGAGGDRDRAKRPLMGNVVSNLSDVVILTSDNPRTEDPERIIDDIASGISTTSFTRNADRRAAIKEALRIASQGEVVLIAGKGHEEYQILGTERIHFSDREIIEEFIQADA